MKLKAKKKKFKGIFNYSYELFILYAFAYTEAQAKEVFFRRLAKLHDVSVWTVRNHFDGNSDNFSIKIEKRNIP